VAGLSDKIAGPDPGRAVLLLRLAVAVVYFWFGALKLFPGASPLAPVMAEAYDFLGGREVIRAFIVFVGVWEMVIGLGFLLGRRMRLFIGLILLQLAGAFSPLVLAPETVWRSFPFGLTLAGQYIVKDLVLLAAVLVIWSGIGRFAGTRG